MYFRTTDMKREREKRERKLRFNHFRAERLFGMQGKARERKIYVPQRSQSRCKGSRSSHVSRSALGRHECSSKASYFCRCYF